MSPEKPTIWRTLRQRPEQPRSVAPAVAAQVSEDAVRRSELAGLLEQLEPGRGLAFAAFLNGTPALTALEQLSSGDVQAMLTRLTETPTFCRKLWAMQQDDLSAGQVLR